MPELETCSTVETQETNCQFEVDPPETSGRQWFALSVKPRYEKAVASALAAKGYETLLPLYRKRHRYGNRCKDYELPLFGGYVFCRFNVTLRLPILLTSGVTQILGIGKRPLPLEQSEIRSLETAVRGQFPLEPFPFLEAGQKVRIEQGALEGVEGIIVRSTPSLRLVLSVTLLRRSVLLEIDRDKVNPERLTIVPPLPMAQ